MAGLVQVERISKSYGRQLAVDGVSFSIAPGEIVGFVGPNGAGKTTTLRVLTGLIAPDSGTVSLGGGEQDLLGTMTATPTSPMTGSGTATPATAAMPG